MNGRLSSRCPVLLLAVAVCMIATSAVAQLLPHAADEEGDKRITMEPAKTTVSALTTGVHIVKAGDTLWDICIYYWGKPWYWPTLWSFNPHITNPHWIYPGDVIYLASPKERPVGVVPGMPWEPIKSRYTHRSTDMSSVARQVGFIPKELVDEAGTIEYSREERMWLAELDEAYVKFEKHPKIKVGQHYAIYTVRDKVHHPVEGGLVGYRIDHLGLIRTTRIDKSHVTGIIERSYREIERGALVGPTIDDLKVVSPVQNQVALHSYVVDTYDFTNYHGQFMYIFLDKGKMEGVRPGNRCVLLIRGDGLERLEGKSREELPWENVGELMVVWTHKHTSLAVVARSVQEFSTGAYCVFKKGY